MFGSRQTSSCHGIAAWRYYPWVNWHSGTDNGQLRSVMYKKQRNDTILRVAFHSTLAQYRHSGCSQWYIQFGGQDCTQPAPITTSIYTDHSDGSNSNNRVPAEVSGFCNATSSGKLSPANLQISVHVKKCQGRSSGDAVTGTNFGQWTSYLLVEEYCAMWWLSLFSMSSISIWTKSFFLFFFWFSSATAGVWFCHYLPQSEPFPLFLLFWVMLFEQWNITEIKLTQSRAGFFGAPAGRGGGGGTKCPPSKNPVPLLRIYSSKVFLKACPKLSLVKQTWFPWKPWSWFEGGS